eukprot:1645094-Karenia_brevis.AAC.1
MDGRAGNGKKIARIFWGCAKWSAASGLRLILGRNLARGGRAVQFAHGRQKAIRRIDIQPVDIR